MSLSESIACATSFCGLWTSLAEHAAVRAGGADATPELIDLHDQDQDGVVSALQTVCFRLKAPELFGPDDAILRDSSRTTTWSDFRGVVPATAVEIRLAWVMRNCERFIVARGEISPTWNKPFPAEPVNSVSATLAYLRAEVARWVTASLEEPGFVHTGRTTASEQWQVLDNVRGTLEWLHRTDGNTPVPEIWTCPRTRFNAGRCAGVLEQWLEGQVTSSEDPNRNSELSEATRPRRCVVELRGSAVRPLVFGSSEPPVTQTQYEVLQVLIDAGEIGLSGRELRIKSRHGSAVNVLKTLTGKSSEWGRAILLPGRPGRHYRLLFR